MPPDVAPRVLATCVALLTAWACSSEKARGDAVAADAHTPDVSAAADKTAKVLRAVFRGVINFLQVAGSKPAPVTFVAGQPTQHRLRLVNNQQIRTYLSTQARDAVSLRVTLTLSASERGPRSPDSSSGIRR